MEPLGLALGVAGLAPLFSTCVQLFNLLDARRTQQADLDILGAMLTVEQVRLCIWGETVGFTTNPRATLPEDLPSHLDRRLADSRVLSVIVDVLECMQAIFEDSEALQQKYGLRSSAEPPPRTGPTATNVVVAPNGQDQPETDVQSTFRHTLDRFNNATGGEGGRTKPRLPARIKWVIADKQRFMLLVQDLRGFNDSLSSLLPDIEDIARRRIAADIGQSTNAQELQLIQEAAARSEHTDFSDAASVQLSRITVRGPLRTTRNVSLRSDSTFMHPVDIEDLSKQLARLDAQLHRYSRGMLTVSITKKDGSYYSGHVSWAGIRHDEWSRAKKVEIAKPPYVAWAAQYEMETECYKAIGCPGYSVLDPMSQPNYEGKYPGTVTVAGYAGIFQHWSWSYGGAPEVKVQMATHLVQGLLVRELAERANILRTRDVLPIDWTEIEGYRDLEKWLGKPSAGPNPGYSTYSLNSQVDQLFQMLNREDIFGDLRDELLQPTHRSEHSNLVLQLCLARELRLRLNHGSFTYNMMGTRVITALELSRRWMNSVVHKLQTNDAGDEYWYMISDVHHDQVEGLIQFAKVMQWPDFAQMREYAEGVYARVQEDQKIPKILWFWLYGVLLPGRLFSYYIMSALLLVTPTLVSLGAAHDVLSCLVLREQSYWYAYSAVGSVLGGLPGTRAACGWVGPCPAPTTEDGEEMEQGWVLLLPQRVPFRLPSPDPTDSGGKSWSIASVSSMPVGEAVQWASLAGDPTQWVIVNPPSASEERCELDRFYLVPEKPVLSPGKRQQFEAKLRFKIHRRLVTFTLRTAPIFIAAHHCLDGPHPVHVLDLPKLQNICSIQELESQNSTGSGVMVIDATGEWGELAARAWCAEKGQHAVVSRGTTTCFSCAVKMASDAGLGVNCLIWVG